MTLLDVKHLTVDYTVNGAAVRALDDVSLALSAGDSLGIVGESGCGKSTLLFAIAQLMQRNARIAGGEVWLDGTELTGLDEARLRPLRWRKMAMVFQGAMNALNPVIRIGKLLAEAYAAHHPGASRTELRARVVEVLDMVSIDPRVMNSYAHELSGGMRQRVVIALGLICRPQLLLADEPTTALDVLLQDRIMGQIQDLHQKMAFGLILVTHDLSMVARTCRRIAIMYAGQIVETGTMDEILRSPRHPYTIGLLQSFPSLAARGQVLRSIPGHPPDLAQPQQGCRFAPRCPHAVAACRTMAVPLVAPVDAAPGSARLARCLRSDVTAAEIGILPPAVPHALSPVSA